MEKQTWVLFLHLFLLIATLKSCISASNSVNGSFKLNPVDQQKLDRVNHLPGQYFNVDFEHYSGYVTVDEDAGRNFFYWFVEASREPSSKPLLLWLNGGPGCSSVGYGEAMEIGPFRVKEDGKTIYLNPYSWNQMSTEINIRFRSPYPQKIDPSVTMMTVEEKPDVTYADVGGCKEQIEKMREVVERPMLHPEKFVKLRIDPPKGVLCYGPPGTGKTLLARAVANRTDACFIRVIGSELVQKYIGEGARMVRELFQVEEAGVSIICYISWRSFGSCRGIIQERT